MPTQNELKCPICYLQCSNLHDLDEHLWAVHHVKAGAAAWLNRFFLVFILVLYPLLPACEDMEKKSLRWQAKDWERIANEWQAVYQKELDNRKAFEKTTLDCQKILRDHLRDHLDTNKH